MDPQGMLGHKFTGAGITLIAHIIHFIVEIVKILIELLFFAAGVLSLVWQLRICA